MKFVCDRCQTKYSIADEKVRGKVLKVRCKTCQNVITVREPGARPSVAGLAPVREARPSGPVSPIGADAGDGDEFSERTVLAAAPAGMMAAALQPRRPTPPPPPPLGAGVGAPTDDGLDWFLALDGSQQGPFTRKVLVDRLLALPRDADVHVWNDQMDGWRSPRDVPDVARDLAARRVPPSPLRPSRPRLTPSPPLPPAAPRRAAPTQALHSGLGPKLPPPSSHKSGAHAIPTTAARGAADAALAFETPPPASAPPRPRKPSNGVTAHASGASAAPHAAFPPVESDALNALNLGNGTARASSSGVSALAAPRLLSPEQVWIDAPSKQAVEGRHRGAKMMVALIGVVIAICLIVTMNFTHKTTTGPVAAKPKGAPDSEAFMKMAEKIAHEQPEPGAAKPARPAEAPSAPEPAKRTVALRAHGNKPARGGVASHAAAVAPPPAGAEDPNAARFRETAAGRSVVPTSAVSNRPAPSQSEISRVIANNKIGIKTCYQRALLRDSSLTHGKITVRVTIGISGRVKNVGVDGPPHFRALEPCIKEMLSRWVFPQSYEEYGTEFSYLFQGNE